LEGDIMNKVYGLTAALMLLCMAGNSAFAGWTVTSLNPTEAASSMSYAVSGGQQAGYAQFSSGTHAGLWSGTAQSWVDLHPAGTSSSEIRGASGGQQVGFAQIGSYSHASLWSGTKESWVDLNPAGTTTSSARGVSGSQQVGYSYFGNTPHAGLWSGTKESWVDLHAFLPADAYSHSYAYSIDVSGGEIWAAGYAWNDSSGSSEAMLWHYTPDAPVPEPSSLLALGALMMPMLAFRRRRG
jgi:hypothetical protein